MSNEAMRDDRIMELTCGCCGESAWIRPEVAPNAVGCLACGRRIPVTKELLVREVLRCARQLRRCIARGVRGAEVEADYANAVADLYAATDGLEAREWEEAEMDGYLGQVHDMTRCGSCGLYLEPGTDHPEDCAGEPLLNLRTVDCAICGRGPDDPEVDPCDFELEHVGAVHYQCFLEECDDDDGHELVCECGEDMGRHPVEGCDENDGLGRPARTLRAEALEEGRRGPDTEDDSVLH